jgi:hypothetical protein
MRKERAVLPTAQISVGQAYAVGVVRAVRDEQGGSYGDAAARVAVYWAPFLVGPSISRKDLENWNSRLKRDDDAQADEFARHLRERFGGKTASVQRILQASINALRATGFKKE